jgi:hypothetical protein
MRHIVIPLVIDDERDYEREYESVADINPP